MSDQVSESGFVSYRFYKTLYDNCLDFCRKLRFIVKAGFTVHEEAIALELISELLKQVEMSLEDQKNQACEEGKIVGITTESIERKLRQYLAQHEDYAMLQRLTDIRKNGGPQWDAVRILMQNSNANTQNKE